MTTKSMDVAGRLRQGDRMGAVQALYYRKVLYSNVAQSSAFTPHQKALARRELEKAYDMLHPFSDEEIVLFNRLWRGEGR
jgi:hypothetical protein